MIANAVSYQRPQSRQGPAQPRGLRLPAEGSRNGIAEVRKGQHAYLTPRQLEVLALLCEGLPNKLICRRLSISAGTAKAHISSILRELGVSSRLQAVVEAGRHGLLANQNDGTAAISSPTGDPLVMPFNLPEGGTRRTFDYAYSRN